MEKSTRNTQELQDKLAQAKHVLGISKSRMKNMHDSFLVMQSEVNRLEKDYNKLKQQYDRIVAENKDTKPPVVSNHALLRYMERRMQMDFSNIEREILEDENVKEFLANNNKGKVAHSSGCILVIENRTVITILPKNDK